MFEENTVIEYAKNHELKYHIETYGCQMNAHDSERIAGLLEQNGYIEAESEEKADLILFNTCCVRENAELKLFGNVGALKQRKKKNKNLIVAVCGCMMQQKEVAEKLAKTFPFVDIIFGTHNMADFPRMLEKALLRRERSLEVYDEEDVKGDIPVKREKGPLFGVNIMQGCDNFCSYCIVPYVRGRERSRSVDDILKEVCGAVKNGYKEVMLLGQNVNSYGKGLPEETDFADLLEKVATETGVERIRFMSNHPKDVSDRLMEVMKSHDNICKQLHLPVQSGSTRVLGEMNRRYTREDYLGLIERVRSAIPDIFISTDIIVGFPGETEEDFEDTLSLVEKVHFDAAFTFVYSPRAGTKAAKMDNQIAEDVKQNRIVRLVALQNEKTFESNKRYVGKVEKVLVEDISKRDAGHICGRTDGGKMVNFEGAENLIGKFVEVEITAAKKTTLYGRML